MPAKRVLISIDEQLLARIDEARARREMTRSGYLAQLAARDLEPGSGGGGDPRVKAALAKIEKLIGGTDKS
ncbi:MAG TPA: ribbon-helix-helix protein, CopG family [Candidatus Limnocylindria bacterium]|nr:ribbon-helix-helix protein, CopG family [Candidatus Limnocylindria bacterium]